MKPIWLILGCLALLMSACGMPFSSVPAPLPIPADAPVVRVVVDLEHPGQPIPTDFLGLSFEAASMTNTAFQSDAALVQILRAIGPGRCDLGATVLTKPPGHARLLLSTALIAQP